MNASRTSRPICDWDLPPESSGKGILARICHRSRGRDLPSKLRPGFAAGIAVRICPQSGGRDLPPNLNNVTTIEDRKASPEKERVMPHQEVKNRMLTCININNVFLSPGTKS